MRTGWGISGLAVVLALGMVTAAGAQSDDESFWELFGEDDAASQTQRSEPQSTAPAADNNADAEEDADTVAVVPVKAGGEAQEEDLRAGPAPAMLQEIIVTARRQEESLQSVPLAIDAITERTLEERGIRDVGDVAELSPSLIFDEGLVPTDTRPVIRSLSSNRGRANVATLVDGVDVSGESMTTGGGGLTANMRLMDLERVEVIKGPQSALYGRSAFSGAIAYITRRPAEYFNGEVSTAVDQFGTHDTRVGLSGPITRGLRGRLNLASWATDGAYRHPDNGDALGDGDSLGAALALDWDATDWIQVYTRVEHSDDRYGPRPVVMRRALLADPHGNRDMLGFSHGVLSEHAESMPWQFDAQNQAICAGPESREYPFFDNDQRGYCRPVLVGAQRARQGEIDLSRDARDGRPFAGTDVSNLRAHLEVAFDWDSFQLQSITASNRNRSRTQEDFDLTSFAIGDPQDPTILQYGFSALSDISHAVDQFSQELRLHYQGAHFDAFLSGLLWRERHQTDWNDLFWMREGGTDIFLFLGLQTATEPDTSTPTTVLRRDVDHRSISASLTWPFLSDFRLTVEGRYLQEQIDYYGTGEDRGAVSALGTCDFMGNPRSSCPPGTNAVSASAFVPRVSLDWQATDHLFSYLTYAEGFKPGGVDTLSANADVTDGEYRPEKLQAWELGLKSDWLGRRLQANGAAFYYRYQDQQQSVQVLNGNTLNTAVVNAGRSDVTGFEIDLIGQLGAGFTAGAGYIMTIAEYVDFNLARVAEQAGTDTLSANGLADAGNASGDYSGKQIRMTPRHAANWNLRYARGAWIGEAYADLSGRYMSRRYLSHGNRSWLPAHTLWDLALGFDSDRWFGQISVSNLLDDDTLRSGLINPDYGFDATAQGGISNGALLILPQPRTLGMRLGYRF